MPSVTQRIKQIKQPRGGYINPKKMLTITELKAAKPPYDIGAENVSAGLVGTAVDYLTRVMSGTPVKDAFFISMKGARMAERAGATLVHPLTYFKQIKGLEDESIVAAIKCSGYDSIFRAGSLAYRPVENISPNAETIENVRTMVNASLEFFKQYGPVTHDGMTFRGGYTDIVDSGDADFMTADTLWDFKCSVKPPTNAHTLQVAMYWLLGMHSDDAAEYRKVTRLGFFNPRLVNVYTVDIADIPIATLHEIEAQVLCYEPERILF